MRRQDRRAWAAARDLDDLGRLVARWLAGEIRQTPSHCGPPDPETRPLAAVLAAVNLAGVVTENSQAASTPQDEQRAGASWNAWAAAFVRDSDLPRLREACSRAGLVIETACRGTAHHGHRRWRGCPRSHLDGFWTERAPQARAAITSAWYVVAADPEDGRNDRLWPALAGLAGPGPYPAG